MSIVHGNFFGALFFLILIIVCHHLPVCAYSSQEFNITENISEIRNTPKEDALVEIRAQKIIMSDNILNDIKFKKSIKYDNVIIIGDINILKIKKIGSKLFIFNTPISITNSTIKGDIKLNDTIFEKEVNFTGTNFEGDSYFGNSQIRASANFEEANFKGEAFFKSANFADISFEHANFCSGANFIGCRFTRNAYFNNAKFGNFAEFQKSIYDEEANFDETRFAGAVFYNCIFKNKLSFADSEFNDSSTFRNSIFEIANFTNTSFKGYSNFAVATFNKNLDLKNSRFAKFAYFKGAIFKAGSSFIGTKFNNAASFYAARFEKTVDFRNVEFNGSDMSPLIVFKTESPNTYQIIIMDIKLSINKRNFSTHQSFIGRFDVDQTVRLDQFMDIDIKYISGLDEPKNFGNKRISMFRLDGYPDPEFNFSSNNATAFIINMTSDDVIGNLTIMFNGSAININNLSLCANFENAFFEDAIFDQKYNSPYNEFDILNSKDKYYVSDYISCSFKGNLSFFNSTFDGKASFSNMDFPLNINFNNAKFKNDADFEGSTFHGIASFSNSFSNSFNFYGTKFFDQLDFRNINFAALTMEWSSLEGVFVCDGPTYQILIKNFREHEQFDDADNCYYNYRLWRQNQLSWLSLTKYLDIIFLITCGYGVRWHYTVLLSLILIIIFAIYFSFKEGVRLHHRIEFLDFKKSIFFSVVVLFSAPTDWYLHIYGESRYKKYILNNKYSIIIERIIGWGLLILLINTLSRVMIRY
jgi:uncharacterized protein YjbI with pentapeptide repeats